ncbi:hypothetical protein IHQ68_05815 [Chelatococcus sambhunathii]|uniref:Secreted protein n=1 Tax=Chelatococcus sambhunathii TaxID=363953 RepID=A0ABU1DDD7_9HYPH|nr:hypothetical protein [Chelatococcus sambhunathii]MDR4306132.1 hypothetical protein [Chelatococcus sambhunathii]
MSMRHRMFAAALVAATSGVWVCDAAAVTMRRTTVNGLAVDLFSWKDSKGLTRTAAMKREVSGNPGHGGYAVQMTYQSVANGVTTTSVANAAAGEGFGYFVGHERYRYFTDGTSDTIAGKIFGADDSPLGRNFALTGFTYINDRADLKGVTYKLNYPKYGTRAANGINPETGEDSPKLGTAQSLFQLYQIPISITWTFQDGRDSPRISTLVDFRRLPGPDRVSFDLRGPYGVLDFDQGSDVISVVLWGDRYRFVSTTVPLTRNSAWTWNGKNSGARYTALRIGASEMGLVEPLPFSGSKINDGYADGRGQTSSTYDAAAAGCGGQKLPCDWEWPYQSAQYSLPASVNGTTTYEKIAWGSTAYYGTSLKSTYDGTTSAPFDGFPAAGYTAYDVCVVLDKTVRGGLTPARALGGGDYNCASSR